MTICKITSESAEVRRASIRRFLFAFFFSFFLFSPFVASAQKIVEKTNLSSWATLSPNLGTEIALSRRWSFDLALSYNPWKISETVSLRHWLLSPEIRWWYCRTYEGSFWGIHALTGQFNIRAIPLIALPKNNEYAGFLIGGGLSYGYNLPLSARWGMEFSAGIGYVRIDYDRYECKECREKIAEGKYNYFGPTRLALSLIYFMQ